MLHIWYYSVDLSLMSKSKHTAVALAAFAFRKIGSRNRHVLTNLTNQTATLAAWWSIVLWLTLLTRKLGDLGSIPAQGIYTNFSVNCLFQIYFFCSLLFNEATILWKLYVASFNYHPLWLMLSKIYWSRFLNSLPTSITNSNSFRIFHKILNHFILSCYFI